MSLRSVIAQETRRQRARLLLACAAAAAAAAAGVGLLGVSGWFLTSAAAAGAAGVIAVQAFNYLIPSAAIRLLAIVRTVARYGERVFGHEAALYALARIRPTLFAGLAAAPPARSLAVSSGEAAGRLVQDVDAVENAFARRSAIAGAAASALVGAGVIALASPTAAIVFLACLGLQVLLGAWLGRRLADRPGADRLRASSALKASVAAGVAGARELRCLGVSHEAVAAILAAEEPLLRSRRELWRAEGVATAASAAVMAVAVVLVLALARGAGAELAALAGLAAAAGMEGAGALVRAFEGRGALEAAVERLDSWSTPERRARSGVLLVTSPEIAIERPGGWVTLRPGERVALVGPSGSGKTRLLSGLAGLSPSPWIRVGGRALDDASLAAARTLFALSAQDAPILSGSVRENLCMGRSLSEDLLWGALEDAALADLVRCLPEGVDTWIGDGGRALSGGERKRLSLARAYLKPAPWLLLDEPTEGLDPETEWKVVDGLRRRLDLTGQGVVIASHRPAPLDLCRAVVDLEQRPAPVAA